MGVFESRSNSYVVPSAGDGSASVREIGEYKVDGLIGEGGYSKVVAAHGPKNKRVALKLFNSEDNFEREVTIHRAAQRFMPNAVPLLGHDTFIPNDEPTQSAIGYAVMERADMTVWDAGILDVNTALDIIEQSAEGLGMLHEKLGLPHCDVTPANLLIAGDVVWIADFGGATYPDEEVELQLTPSYSAPELLQGEVSPAVDQYGLGVTLFEAIHGTPPFPADALETYETMVLSDDYQQKLTARIKDAELPAELEGSVKRALHPNPRMRFPSVTTFAEDLLDRRREALESVGQQPVVVYDMNRQNAYRDRTQQVPQLAF